MMDLLNRALTALESIAASLVKIASTERSPTITVEEITEAEANAGNIPAVTSPTVTDPGHAVTTSAPVTVTMPAQVVQPETGVTEVDKEGLPWDARIHGTGKSFLRSTDRAGCWKYKKGVDAALVAQVEAELRATAGVTGSQTQDTPPVNSPSVFSTPTVAPQVAQVETPKPVIEEITKDELVAAMTVPVANDKVKLAHINYLMTQVIQRDGVPTAQLILGQYSGGCTSLTDVPENLFTTMYAVFFNQWNYKNPQGAQA